MTMNTKTLAASAVRTAKGFTATITTETIDRDGEVLVASGMNSKEFDRNPVVLWMHDHTLPVGKVTKIRRASGSISADVEFAPRPEGYIGEWFPDYIAGLVGAGVISAVSVGFMETDGGTRLPTKADIGKYGDGIRRVFSRWKLLELSVVSVPANADALISAVHKGLVTPDAAKRWGGVSVPAAVQPIRKKRVSIRVPAIGTAQIEAMVQKAIREEMARMTGRLYV